MIFSTRMILAGSLILLGAACGAPGIRRSSKRTLLKSIPCNWAAKPPAPGTLNADSGEYQPADPAKFHKEPGYSPYAGRRYPERPYFGDEHVHTSWSVDAGGSGTTPGTGGSHAIRARRGSDGHQRPAGKTWYTRWTGS